MKCKNIKNLLNFKIIFTNFVILISWESTPDSPRQIDQIINPESDVYAIPSLEGNKH